MKAQLLLLAAALPAGAQLAVDIREVVRHPYGFIGMQVVDLDGDGDDDLLLSGSGNNLTAWCENRGDGNFCPPAVIEMSPRIFNWGWPFTPDLTGQGYPDLVTRWSTTRTRNQGAGGFAAPEPLPGTNWPVPNEPDDVLFRSVISVFPGSGSTPDRLIVEDWDGPLQANYRASFYSLNGQGEPSLVPIIAGGVNLLDHVGSIDDDNLFPVDIDRDGDIDLVYQYSWLTDPVVILRNQGNDTFEAREDLQAQGLYSINAAPPVLLDLPGQALPALVVIEHLENGSSRIVIRTQSESGGSVNFDPADPQHRIPLPAGDSIHAMTAVPGDDGDELWLRLWPNQEEGQPLPKDRLQCFRFIAGTGWQKTADLTLPCAGLGEVRPLAISAGNPGLVCRMGGYPGVNADTEDKVIWASLASLRSGSPAWQTIAGPFNDFSDFRVADLDLDGKLDLVSGEGNHGLGGGKSGRIHFIHDLEGERVHRVIDTEDTDLFGGASPLPGNRIVIGDANGDALPDLSVSSGFGGAIRLLENLGNREFGPPMDLVASDDILRPLRLDATRHRFFDGSRIFSQAPAAGAPATLLHDLGIAGQVVFTDMDGDGDDDVVAAPCPLGNVTGWGKTGPAGTVVSWHFLSSAVAREIRDDSGIAGIGWIDAGPVFKRVRDGVPGIAATLLPATVPVGSLWPPVDLDGDGDFDLLALQGVPDEEDFGISPTPQDLVWHENRGSSWQLHPESLVRPWYAPASIGLAVVQPLAPGSGSARVLFGNTTGEVFQLDFSAPVPGGSFGAWLASFNLTGAAAGAESDPDDDGLTNLEEALQGSPPVAATPGGFAIPVAFSPPDGWGFSSALDLAGSGISVVTEVSGDLDEWTDLPDEPVLSVESGGRYHYRVADEDMAGEERRFVRFRFRWIDP